MLKNFFLIIFISFLISNISYSEEKTLRCLFVLGERNEFTENGTKTFEFGIGDKEDEYLVIDFEKERIKSAPYYQGFFSTNFTFQPEKITWSKTKKNNYTFYVELNRVSGRLQIIYNSLPTGIGSYNEEYFYTCENFKTRF